ncbi:hypothetical protein [Gemmata sp.]|uniref:hypothetical protein n=1 Tax=Gemmata sp. TaxID=1914242 RepID=UPI003F6FD90B
MVRNLLTAAVVVALGGLLVAGDAKPGLKVGDKVPGPFHPLNVNGEDAGKKACLYCKAGDSPTVAVFARDPGDAALQKLIAMLEEAATKYSKQELNTFVVFCSAESGLEPRLKDVAEKVKLKHVILAIDAPEGPEKYNIAKDADVTVIVYKDLRVVGNHTFAKGKLDDKALEAVAADVAKIVK